MIFRGLTERIPASQAQARACGESRRDNWLGDSEARGKPGRLWTWDDHQGQANFRVLPANEVQETAHIMPSFGQNSAKWSIAKGVYYRNSRRAAGSGFNCTAHTPHTNPGQTG